MFGIWPAAPINVSCTTLSGDSTLDIDAVLTSHSFATRFTKRSFCWGSKLSNIKEGLDVVDGRSCVICLDAEDDGGRLFPTAPLELRDGGGNAMQAALCASQT